MFAVIETGGKQYKVEVGQTIKIEQVKAEIGSEIALDRVLIANEEGGKAAVGTPALEGAKVTARVKAHGRGKKILVQKHRRRKQYRRIHGHRQNFTEIEILNIQV